MNIGFYRIGEDLGALARTILDIGNSPSGQIPAWKNKKFLVWLGFLEWDCSGKPVFAVDYFQRCFSNC